MKKLRKGRIIAGSLIVVLLVAIFSIIRISKIDKFEGLVKINNSSLASISTKLSANISDLSEDNAILVNGYDEIDYNIRYRLSAGTDRDVIINAKVDANDQYATFKEVTGSGISSVLSSDRKEITITISNLPSDQEIDSKVTLIIENAPKGYTVNPTVRIKESTSSDYTNITVKPVTVNTNSVQGTVIDEDGNKVPNIIISLKKNNQIIKETYTNEDGVYTLSDITPDTYSIVVNEELYENVEVSDLYIADGNMLNLIVKRVHPYKIETNKYITKVELNNLGVKKDYLYNDVELAQIPVKRVNDLHGKIYYKITVQNAGEKSGIVASVKDELPEGLSFDEKLNSGYELKDGIIYNRNLEGVELSAGEQISDTLVLTIDNTDVARTYINQVNAKGELYEHVVYLLNGRQYKTLDVLEGEKIEKLEVANNNFSGWYTDEKLTNKYNFNLPVEKDLILYGVTTKKHTVIFNDKNPETLVSTEYDRQEVENGDTADEPDPDPSHEGYTFCGWDTEDGNHWDFNTPVTEDLTLTSCYTINEFKVDFYDNSMNDGNDFELISTLTKVYKSTLSNSEAPDLSNAWEGHNFLKWTTDPEGNNVYDFAKEIKSDIKLYAQYTLQDRLFIFNDENRITEKTVEYGGTVSAIADQGKVGHTFKHWSLEPNGTTAFDFSTRIYQTTTVYAVYQINVYDVIFNDVDPETTVPTEYDRQEVEHGDTADEPTPDPSHTGYDFCGWYLNDSEYDFDTPVTSNITLTSCYEPIDLTVTFMDGDNLYEQKTVKYGSKVTDTTTHPSKEHHIFKFWSEDNINGFNYDTVIKQNKTLYSVYEEVIAPTISHAPLYWTNQDVTVTVIPANANYTNKYKVADGSYQDYTEPFALGTNSTITAKSEYQNVESALASHEVTNIDKLDPTISDKNSTATQTTATLSASLSDAQSGVASINIYQDNVLIGTVSGTVVDAEMRDYTKSKSLTYDVVNLEPDTEYVFTIQVTDGAGNVTSETISVTTEAPGPIPPVCRIISIDGVDLPEEDYIEFPLLDSAIKDVNCTTKCTIQMIANTTESVNVLETQDITLDLNGFTVSGARSAYTLQNEGKFTLIDHADTPGALINNSGIALLNSKGTGVTAKLTLGEGSSEPPSGSETRTVSTTAPYVFGETYGVYIEGGTEFAFFDGKVVGTDAVQGEVTETEYSYNASSGTQGSYEAVALAQLDDPEARINKSVYYSNVGNAVADAKIGTIEDDPKKATFLSGFTHRGEDDYPEDYTTTTGYKFVYDEENDTLTSTNDYYGSVAFTETIIDLTDAEKDQFLDITYRIDPSTDGTVGEKTIKVYYLNNNYAETGGTVSQNYDKNGSIGFDLPKGNKYKVSIKYTQPVQMTGFEYIETETGYYNANYPLNTSTSKLVITGATVFDEEKTVIDNAEIGGGYKTYGFYYDENTNTLRSNNQYVTTNGQRYAYGYYEIDLTGKTGTYDLSVTASVESADYNSAYVYISEDAPAHGTYFDSSRSLIYVSTKRYDKGEGDFYDYPVPFAITGPFRGTQTLQGGKKYYMNLLYNKDSYNKNISQSEYEQYNISDQFIINSIELVKTGDVKDIILQEEMIGNAFDLDNPITYWGNQYYTLTSNNRDEYHDSYIKVDLTDSPKDKVLEIDSAWDYYNYVAVYITNNNRGLTNEDINANRYNMLQYKDDWMIVGYPGFNGNYPGSLVSTNYLLKKGNVYYIHFNVQLGFSQGSDYDSPTYDCYNATNGGCGANLKGIKIKDVKETLIDFGNTPVNTGTVDYDSLPLDSNTITDTPDTSSITTQQDLAGYRYDSETGYYKLDNPIKYYEFASFVTEIDLTNATEMQSYKFTHEYSGSYYTYYSYYTTDILYPVYYNGYGNYQNPPDYYYLSNGTYFSLEPGHKYYLYHYFIGGSSNNAMDQFKIEKIDGEKTTEYTKGNGLILFNEDVDEIQILKDIQLQSSIVVDAGKEAVLDLNGYTITSSLSTPIIDNFGKLTVIDSDYKNQTSDNKVHNGIIQGSAGNLIKNEGSGELILENFVMNVNGAYRGIDNYGSLTFKSGFDSKIIVTPYDAFGVYNNEFGRVNDAYSAVEIVLNYNNGADVNYNLYTSLRNTYSWSFNDYINTGFYNNGYVNMGGIKISGKNGRGFVNTWSGTAILKTVNISVDINARDKTAYHSDVSPFIYQLTYSSGGYSYYKAILAYSIYNTGTMTLTNGSSIGYRVYNSKELHVLNSTSMDFLYNGSGKLFMTNSARANDLLIYGEAVLPSATVVNTLDNYGKTQVFSGTYSGSTINNHATFEGVNASYNFLNNYDNGTMMLANGSAKHINNDGKEVTLNSFSVFNSGTSFSEAIRNTGILNLEYGVTITDSNQYGIFMAPKQTSKSVTFRDGHNISRTYTEYTYKQAALNIDTKGKGSSTVAIYGKEYGVTGQCYQNAEKIIYGDTAKDTKFLTKLDGTTEPVTQSNYEQDFCLVNMYSGFIKATDYANYPVRTLDIPISETRENAYTKFSGGLSVIDEDKAIENNTTVKPAKIGDTEYISLKAAVDSITTSTPTTIDLLWYSDISSVVIPEGRNITINITDEHNIFLYARNGSIVNNGNLTITGEGTGKIIELGKYFIVNNGTLNFNSGTFNNNNIYWTERSAVLNNSIATINGGTFGAMDLNNKGTMTINNGTFNGTMIYGDGSSSTTTLKSGVFSGSGVNTRLDFLVSENQSYKSRQRHIFELSNGATAIIDGYNTDNIADYQGLPPIGHLDNSTIEFRSGKIGGGTYTSPHGVPYDDETGSKIAFVAAENDSNVIFTDGTWNQMHVNLDSSTVTVNGGTVSSKGNSLRDEQNLIYMHGERPVANIVSGKLESNNNPIGVSDFKKSTKQDRPDELAYNIIIGTKGDLDQNNNIICSKTDPEIKGEQYGIAKYGRGTGDGFLGFYDGIIKGKSAAVDINVTEIEDDFEIITENIDGYEAKYLDQKPLVKNITTGEIYTTFQKAFDEAASGDQLVTLRDYTNTATTRKITVSNSANFSLYIGTNITINNEVFIENNGNMTVYGYGSVTNSGEYSSSGEGLVTSNVSGNIFVNNGTLTLNSLEIVNIKATNNETTDILLNKENATLNINGSKFTTLQHSFVNNYGTLNIDKTGNDNCYNTTQFIVDYVVSTDCFNIKDAIINSGTANINYMTLQASHYCSLVDNTGTMKIDHSAIDQSSDEIDHVYSDRYSEAGIIKNSGNIEIDNSKIKYIPAKAYYDYGQYSNSISYQEYYYIRNDDASPNTTRVLLNNNEIDTSIYGLVMLDGYTSYNDTSSTIYNYFDMRNTTFHSNSYAIKGRGKVDINLKDNNVSTRDAIIDSQRYLGNYSDYKSITYLYNNPGYAFWPDSIINIDGGTYTSNGTIGQYNGYYTPLAITYNTTCTGGTMDTVTTDTTDRAHYFYGKNITGNYGTYANGNINAIVNNGTINISNATINLVPRDFYSQHSYVAYNIYPELTDSSSNIVYNPSGYFAALQNFGSATIINSEINVTDGSKADNFEGVYNHIDSSELTLGEKDGVYDNQKPKITTKVSGPIKGNKGVESINFYDGILETTSTYGFSSHTDSLFADKETGYIITGNANTRYLVQEPVIKNLSNNVTYTSIQAAIDASSSGDTLQLLISVIKSSSTDTVSISNKDLTLDINCNILGSDLNISNGSNVTIKNGTCDGTGRTDTVIVNDTSSLTINGGAGTIKANGSSTVTINNNESSHAIYGYDNATINYTNATGSVVELHDSSELNVSDTKIDRVSSYDTSNINTSCTSNDDTRFTNYTGYSTNQVTLSCGDYGTVYNWGGNTKLTTTGKINTVTSNAGTVVIENGTYGTISNSATMSITNATCTNSIRNNSYNTGGVATMTINGGTYKDFSTDYINVNGSVTTIIDGSFERIFNYNNSSLTILGGTYKHITNYYNTSNTNNTKVAPTLIIGTKDGNVSTTSPVISNDGTVQGGYALNLDRGTAKFYDGIITGPMSVGAITGLVDEVEENYKISVVDNGDDTESAYLTVISNNDPRYAMVNGINYTSIQQAVNKAVLNCSSGTCPKIILYHNVELDADLTIASGYHVDITSNGYTVSTNGFNVPETITIDGEPIPDDTVSGDILNGIRGMLGIEDNTKSIIVYEMSDGSALSTENHYRLYEYNGSDYDLVSMEKGDSVARYNPGKGLTNMKPIKGRLYLNNLKPGSYKVSDDNGSTLTFTINDDGTLSGHIKEYIPSSENIESTGTAKLIITIQTGIRKVNYMLIAISLIAVLSIMFVIKRKRENS